MRYKLEELETRIKNLQDYIGPKVGYDSDKWPRTQPRRWLMEYLDILKRRYYNNSRRKNARDNKKV